MAKLTKASRLAYGIGLMGMVVPHLYYLDFGANFLPPWPGIPWLGFWVCLFTLLVITTCSLIILEIKGRTAALLLGGVLLAMLIFGGVLYELLIDPQRGHLFAWGALLTGSAITGGAFVVAGSFGQEANAKNSPLIRVLEKLIPLGNLLFCVTMIGYGCFHFVYTDGVESLIPKWVPFPIFWVYLAGVALIVGGFAIVFRIKLKLAATLMGVLIIIFLLIVHIPLVVADPLSNELFQVTRIFGGMAFVGSAFLIAVTADAAPKRQPV